MGIKPHFVHIAIYYLFESSVILYGYKAQANRTKAKVSFESSVILYGCKAIKERRGMMSAFESSVILYGYKA